MNTTPERRLSERARIPCNIPVELSDTKRERAFDAAAVDLSVGGLSLRAARVPELGSLLFCSFEAMPGGATVLGRGEVVWRQPTERGGEFGLRFVEVDAKNQAMIDEMVAERIARIQTPFTKAAPVIANLEIENVDKPVAARLVHNGENEALFEQSLDLLSLGKAVIAHAGVSLLRGHIAQVNLRMDGVTPMLAIKLQVQRDPARFGEFEWGEPGSDTDPDVFAHGHPGQAKDEADADVEEDDDKDDDDKDDDQDEGEDDAPGDEAATSATLPGFGSPLPAPILAREEEGAKQLPLLFKRDPADTQPEVPALRLTLTEFAEEPDRVYADEAHARALLEATSLEHVKSLPDPISEALAPHDVALRDEDTTPGEEQPHPGLVSALRVVAAVSQLGERAKEGLSSITSKLRNRTGQRIVGSRSRKVTTVASRGQSHEEGLSKLAKVVACVLFVGATGLLAFVFMPTTHAPLPEPLETDVRAASDEAQLVSANPGALLGGSAPEADSANTPGAAPSSPYAVDIRARKPAAAPPSPSPKLMAAASVSVFGHAQVPNGKRYLLRMQNPVGMIQGVTESDGFSVVLPGNKALEKAAPIKAGMPAIASAAIVNFKDHAELHVRFVPGKRPTYRISGQGTNLEVLITP